MQDEFEDEWEVQQYSSVDMIVFGVLVQIWYRAQPQAKQEAKSAK